MKQKKIQWPPKPIVCKPWEASIIIAKAIDYYTKERDKQQTYTHYSRVQRDAGEAIHWTIKLDEHEKQTH